MNQRFHSIALLICTAVPAGIALVGCPKIAEVSMQASSAVPAPNGCEPDRGVCINWRDAGIWLPAHCSASHRPWPQLPLNGAGDQRTCAEGEGCAINDAGRAHCTARDGGL